MKSLLEVSHRGVTADHYLDGKKYMIWYHLDRKHKYKDIGVVQVRGIKKPLTENELKIHIDKLWDRYYKEKEG